MRSDGAALGFTLPMAMGSGVLFVRAKRARRPIARGCATNRPARRPGAESVLAGPNLAESGRQRYAGGVADSELAGIQGHALPEYGDDGVDVTLVRWMLSLTPAERLQFLQERIDDVRYIRELNAGK